MLIRRVTIVIMILTVALQTFNKSLLIVDYEVNKYYISQVLCENKDAPQKNCMGKCHLYKQLQHQNNAEQKPAGLSKEKAVDLFFVQTESRGFYQMPKATYSERNVQIHPDFRVNDLFRPPWRDALS